MRRAKAACLLPTAPAGWVAMSRAVPDQGCVGDDDLGRDGPVRVRGRGCLQREQCAANLAVLLLRAGRSMRLGAVLLRIQDTTAEIRVRFAIQLLVAMVALAGHLGLETIVRAFLAGAIVGLVDRDASTHRNPGSSSRPSATSS